MIQSVKCLHQTGEFSSPHETQTILRSYIQATVTYIVSCSRKTFDSCWEGNTVVCCKELFTDLVSVVVDIWYSLAWSCRLIHVSVKGAWRICHCKANSSIIYSFSYPQLDKEVSHSYQPAVQLVPPWDGGTWLGSQEDHVLSSQWRQCKAPLGPVSTEGCFTELTFEWHLQHLITNIWGPGWILSDYENHIIF